MKVDTNIAFWTWSWRWELLLLTSAMTVLYVWGWRRRRRQATAVSAPTLVQLFLFLTGTAVLLFSWVSPLHALATQLFSMRMAQDLLLVALAPGLILASNPLPLMFAALPARWQRIIRQPHPLFVAQQPFWRTVTSPGAAFLLFVAGVWVWYDPWVHQATLAYPRLHQVETVILPMVALLYWRHILQAAPYRRPALPPLVRILYTALGTAPIKIMGLILLFNGDALYAYPGSLQLTGLHINDYHLGAMVAWLLGGTVFSTTAVIQMRAWLSQEAAKPSLPQTSWDTEFAMKAPGFPPNHHKPILRQSQSLD